MECVVAVPLVLQIAKSQASDQRAFTMTLLEALDLIKRNKLKQLKCWVNQRLELLGISIWPIEFINGVSQMATLINHSPVTGRFSDDATELCIRFTA